MTTTGDTAIVDPKTFIKDADGNDWQAAISNRKRPVLVQCGRQEHNTQFLKQILTDAVIKRNGGLEFLYVDVDSCDKMIKVVLNVRDVPVCFIL